MMASARTIDGDVEIELPGQDTLTGHDPGLNQLRIAPLRGRQNKRMTEAQLLTNHRPLPSGTATFVFTDIQGSTTLVQGLGLERWREILDAHHQLLREQWSGHNGHEVKTEGDAFFVAFGQATDAVAACADAQRSLAGHPWPPDAPIRVRMGLHTGEAHLVGDNDYIGLDVHRAARIVSTAHGGQVVISESTQTLVAGILPDGVSLVDLGEHRLKDLSRPEHLYQLKIEGLSSDFPPLKSLDRVINNLPSQMTSFVGRDKELVRGRQLLEQTRLLTLTGPGGTGKTRLSMQIAADVSDSFKHGVFFVPLAPISDPDLVPSAVVQAIGVQDVGSRDPLDALIDHVKDKALLVVLDNFEQVLPAGASVSRVLKEAAEIKFIATSRAPLRLYGEQEFPIPPLALPDASGPHSSAAISDYEGIRLFIERALAVKPDFEVTDENAEAVVQICELLDGLPLAVELAAARIRLFSPQAMLSRLQSNLSDLSGGARDLPQRQQTLRGAISWSYDLLADDVKTLMARFAVFVRGGFLADIEAVCGPISGRQIDVLSGLEALVEQNLVRPVEDAEEPRFMMLHVIREFALEELEASGEADDIRSRHAAAFLSHAEEVAPRLTGADSTPLLDRLVTEHDNLRAALGYMVASGKDDNAMRLVSALWRFWQQRGYLLEGMERIKAVLALPGTVDFPLARMRALEAGGGIAWWRGDVPTCIGYYEQALALARELGSQADVANALYNLAFPLGTSKDTVDRALELSGEAVAAFDALGDRARAARGRWGMAGILVTQNRYEEASDLAEGAATTFRELGLRFDLIWALHYVGLMGIRLNRLDRAREALIEGFTLLSETGDLTGYPIYLGDFSDLAIAEGDPERSVRLRGASSRVQAQTGAGLEDATSGSYHPRETQGAEISEQRARELLEEGRAMTPAQAVAYALGGPPAAG
jgi:predicted ATPase/class 3 adenylate cyclase